MHPQVWEQVLYTKDIKETVKPITTERQFSSFPVSGPSQKITEDLKQLFKRKKNKQKNT